MTISNNISETVVVRWVHAEKQFVGIELPFHHATFCVIATRASPG